MERFRAKNVTRGNLQFSVSDVAAKSQFIGLIFAAHSCPSCRNFLPFLEKFRSEIAPGNSFNVIFASYDKTLAGMQGLLKSYPEWYALPWNDPDILELADVYDIDGIPTLIILRQDLSLVTIHGRDDIMLYKHKTWQNWCDTKPPSATTSQQE
ncbi:probable nucleoredoxin 3 [Varroa jacobsoni]|uniref:protein-disulfide reductase n=1 Tax=Varroa destructor TaxID=109461 RepID=A0A7M7KR93_VARDE|nr:probable nucleoredoxin 3 [Varroa destructor]XP_022708458.1 probable nucleoredoxin 3 [Varroa jacobsoni]